MPERFHFEKAPIQEAIIDIRVSLDEKVVLSEFLEEIGRAFAEEYPGKQNLIEGYVHLEDNASLRTDQPTITGVSLISQDNRQIVQITRERFAFSLLEPYPNWKDFTNLARKAWNTYEEKANITSFNRLAVRFINRFDFPDKKVDLEQYFTIHPNFPEEIGSPLIAYGMRGVVEVPEVQGFVVISQSPVPPKYENGVSILLDIDLYSQQNMPQQSNGVWQLLDKFRDAKNRIFIACIKEDAKELIS